MFKKVRFPLAVLLSFLVSPAQAQPEARKPTKAEWQAVVDQAVAALKKGQDDKGGWSTAKKIGRAHV